MLDGPLLDDELIDKLSALDGVGGVEFSPECSTQAKPAVLIIKPTDSTSVEELEDIALRTRELLERVLDGLQTDVAASIEHPVEPVHEDGELVDLESIEDEHLARLRFRQRTVGGLSATRLDGYALDGDISPTEDEDLPILDEG